MAQATANFELGVNGSDVLVADAGSAIPWDSTNHDGGDVITYDSAHAYQTLAAKVDSTTSGGASKNTLNWTAGIGTLTDWYGRVYLYATSNPGGSYRVVSDQNGLYQVYIQSAGKVQSLGGGGASITSSASINLNGWTRIEYHWINSVTVGQMEFKLFLNPDSETPTETQTSAATVNTGASSTTVSIGLSDGGSSAGPIWLDNIVAGATSYPGPVSAAAPGDNPPIGILGRGAGW